MRAKDIEVGQEVSVLRHGSRADLATASVERRTVIQGYLWVSDRWRPRPIAVTGLDGEQFEVHRARPDPKGTLLLVSGPFGSYKLVPLSRILGPAEEWESRIAAAKEERQREREARRSRDDVLDGYAGTLREQLRAAGVGATIRRSGGVIDIILFDLASAERLAAILTRAAELGDEA